MPPLRCVRWVVGASGRSSKLFSQGACQAVSLEDNQRSLACSVDIEIACSRPTETTRGRAKLGTARSFASGPSPLGEPLPVAMNSATPDQTVKVSPARMSRPELEKREMLQWSEARLSKSVTRAHSTVDVIA